MSHPQCPPMLSLALAALVASLPAALFSRAARAQDDAQQVSDTAPPPPPADFDESAPPPPEALPPAQPPGQAAFDQALSPYGRWVDTPDYGRVWIPASSAQGDWQPYTNGSWVYTESGWAFASDVPWGWAVFHYGRWGFRDGLGWFWVPGYTWAPAWVSWRYSNGHVGWSPYGPRGFQYGSHWRGWVAMPSAHFTHPIVHEMLPRAHVGPIIRAARPAPSIRSAPERGHAYGPPRHVAGPPQRSPQRSPGPGRNAGGGGGGGRKH
jgi:hypothetical protein